MVEILYTHGGSEGLRQAVLLVKSAHEQGVLNYYSVPKPAATSQRSRSHSRHSSGGSAGGGGGAGGKGEGERARGEGEKPAGRAAVVRVGSKVVEEEEEAAQKQGERTASLVAHAALDVLGEHDEVVRGGGTGQQAVGRTPTPGAGGVLRRLRTVAEAPASLDEAAADAGGASTGEHC